MERGVAGNDRKRAKDIGDLGLQMKWPTAEAD
jgi:hypothetical protein